MADSKKLEERVKELTCLYRVSSLDEKKMSAGDILQKSVGYLAEAVQFPENCAAQITYQEKRYSNVQPGPTIAEVSSIATISKTKQLKITLGYQEKGNNDNSGVSFLQEEQAMLDAVCKQLASKLNWMEVNKELELYRLTQNRSYLNAKIGSWEYDFENNEIYLSEILATLLETDVSLARSPRDLLKFIAHKEDRERLKNQILKAIKLHEPIDLEVVAHTGSGKKIWMKMVGEPKYDGSTCRTLFGTVQNIQRWKEVEKALSERNQFIETALENLPIGIAINTISDGKTQLMNQKFSDVYGWSEKEITDVETFFNKVYPDKKYRDKITKKIIEDLKSKDPAKMNWEGISVTQKSGEKRIVNAKNIPLYQQDLMISTVTDVTERFRAEEQLRANERRFKALVQDGSDLIAILNLSGEFTYISPTSKLILGILPENAIGRKMLDFVHEDDQKKITEIMNNLPDRRRFNIKQVRFKIGKGRYKWLEASVTNMLHEPSIGGFVVNAHDITDRIKHQNDMKKALAEKEVLLSEIHHRVKNNLAVISGMMQLQLYDESNPDVQDKLNDGMLRIQTMANIHELLYNTKSFAELSFRDIIQKLANNVMAAMSRNKDVDLRIKSEPVQLNINQAIPCSLIINEVLTNIFKHAFKGQKKGKIEIFIHQQDEKVGLKIADDGVGLPEDFNLDDGRSLGKNIIKILSEQLEARIQLYSKGNGTTFALNFEAQKTPSIS
jgi:PAS domain S-box-containing protein